MKINHQAVADFIVANPTLSYVEIGRRFRIHEYSVCVIAKEFGVTRKRGSASKAHPVQPGSKKVVL